MSTGRHSRHIASTAGKQEPSLPDRSSKENGSTEKATENFRGSPMWHDGQVQVRIPLFLGICVIVEFLARTLNIYESKRTWFMTSLRLDFSITKVMFRNWFRNGS